jgi:hypothetical protein
MIVEPSSKHHKPNTMIVEPSSKHHKPNTMIVEPSGKHNKPKLGLWCLLLGSTIIVLGL